MNNTIERFLHNGPTCFEKPASNARLLNYLSRTWFAVSTETRGDTCVNCYWR